MKLQRFKTGVLAVVVAAALSTFSCKGKNTGSTAEDSAAKYIDTSAATTDPYASSGTNDALRTRVTDATKDYPGVTATVENGEVTLTGTIGRDRLPKLMQAVQALNPKKVNNNLTIE